MVIKGSVEAIDVLEYVDGGGTDDTYLAAPPGIGLFSVSELMYLNENIHSFRYTQTENENSPIQGGAAKYVSSVPPPSTYSETSIASTEPLMNTSRPTLSKTTSTEDDQNELATKELNLLAQLIGSDILANDRQSRNTFKINLFDQEKTNNLEKPK